MRDSPGWEDFNDQFKEPHDINDAKDFTPEDEAKEPTDDQLKNKYVYPMSETMRTPLDHFKSLAPRGQLWASRWDVLSGNPGFRLYTISSFPVVARPGARLYENIICNIVPGIPKEIIERIGAPVRGGEACAQIVPPVCLDETIRDLGLAVWGDEYAYLKKGCAVILL